MGKIVHVFFYVCKYLSLIAANTMSPSVDATYNVGTIDFLKCVKLERVVYSWVDPLNGTPLEIIFDKKALPSRKEIFDKYVNLCSKRPTPKHLKVGRDFLEEKVETLFGPSINRNRYRYCHTNDEELIVTVENLFMVAHQ